jgi:hypothetical protein
MIAYARHWAHSLTSSPQTTPHIINHQQYRIMGWSYGRRTSSKSRRVGPVNPTAWQTKGETMSLSNACAMYGVTQEDCQEAKLPCQWRSAYGNSYAVVKVSDILALKQKLAQEEEEKKKQELIAEHGEKGYERMKREEEERKKAEVDAKQAAFQAELDQSMIVDQVMKILSLSKDGCIESVADIDNVTFSKSAAKSEFFLNDSDLSDLTSETVGKTTKYSAFDVIQTADRKHVGGSSAYHSKPSLLEKIQAKPTQSRMSHYTGYLKKKLDYDMEKLSKHVRDGAMAQVQAKLQTEVEKTAAQIKAAEEAHRGNQAKVRSFQQVFGVAEENDKPKKKAKMTAA